MVGMEDLGSGMHATPGPNVLQMLHMLQMLKLWRNP